MSTYYYANEKNEPVGPVTLDELQRLAREGAIRPDTNVIPHGAAAWSKWSTIAATLPATAAPANPPPLASGASYAGPSVPASTAGGPDWIRRAPLDNVAQVREAISGRARSERGLGFFSILFGTVLAIVESFVLPGRVFMRALADLSDWGKAGRLPTTETDLPVLTYQVVVVRALMHLLVTLFSLLTALAYLVSPIFDRSDYETTGTKWNYAILGFFAWLFIAYFLNIVVALIYELFGMGIRLINYVKIIADRE